MLADDALDRHLFPSPFPSLSSSTLSLVFNGYRRGMIEPCGCVAHKLGGIDKEARLPLRLTGLHIPHVLVDAGGFTKEATADAATTRTRLQLEALHSMHIDAINVSFHDLGLGVGFVREEQTSWSLPLISCNVVDNSGALLFPAFKKFSLTLQSGEALKVGVIGVTRPRLRSASTDDTSTTNETRYVVADVESSLRKWLPLVVANSDFTIVLLYDTRDEARKLIDRLGPGPKVNVVVAGESQGQLTTPMQINGTWLVGAGFEGRQVGHMLLVKGKDGTTVAGTKMVEVLQSLPPVPELSAIVERSRSIRSETSLDRP